MLRPRRFTYPYHYTPHPLCVAAADEVRAYLRSNPPLQAAAQEGKMFGVLVTEQGFLAAFSGELAGSNKWPWFVPPVFDLMHPGSYFQEEEKAISAINHTIESLHAEGRGPSSAQQFEQLKTERKSRSQALQRWLFEQYRFLNAEGEERNLLQIFEQYYQTHSPVSTSSTKSTKTTPKLPPSGSGECCAPKLLQAAYRLGLQPIAMAEFWIGQPPKDELRIEGHYYPACSGKCRPILDHMMRGLDVEENPLLHRSRTMAAAMKVIFSDAHIAVIDKPSGMLSVPGNDPEMPSVLAEAKRLFPHAAGPIIVHRLDMDTSGLMVLALTEEAYHHLQQQFITHKTVKRYVALLERDGRPAEAKGEIALPICPNPYDRPRQMVSLEYGKKAATRYEMIDEQHVLLWPLTGRTHQLRVHCAHPNGLGHPIVGDALYGSANHPRLCLHADTLTFTHPQTLQTVTFVSPAPF